MSSQLTIRGPKKKKGPAKSEAPESSDIVNIFKDRPDAQIYSSDRYPPWLMRMLNEQYSTDDILVQIYHGERIPTGEEQWPLANSFKRQMIVDQNKHWFDNRQYESEDDVGEDLGEGQVDEEEQQRLAEEAAEASAAAGEGGEKKEGEKKEGGDKKDAGDKDDKDGNAPPKKDKK